MQLNLLALSAFVLLAGCEKAVTVVSPDSYPDKPVTSITVQFSPNYRLGSFQATLDGQDITPLFAPAPAPGGQSTANLQGQECGFAGGETSPPSPPPPMRAVAIENRPRDQSPSSGAAPAQPQPGPSSAVSALPPPPADLTVFWHRIKVDGRCDSPRICEGDERLFLPLHLVGVPIKLPLQVRTPQSLRIETWLRNAVAIDVSVKPELANVKLNGGALGASTSTVIPPASQSPPIVVEGILRPSQHRIWLCSPGVQRGVVYGPIN